MTMNTKWEQFVQVFFRSLLARTLSIIFWNVCGDLYIRANPAEE